MSWECELCIYQTDDVAVNTVIHNINGHISWDTIMIALVMRKL